MKIVGCDLHARQQTIAMVDTETGEFTEKTISHEGNAVREFYAALEGPVVVGIEATGAMQWRHVQMAALLHKPARVEPFVAAYGHRPRSRNLLQHHQCRVAFRCPVGGWRRISSCCFNHFGPNI
jgi:hypothetical protein